MVFAAFRFTASPVEEMAMIGVLDVSLVISVTTGGPHAHDEPTPEPNQVRGKFGNPVGAPGRITRLDEDISIGS
jgi:hypothetical protein